LRDREIERDRRIGVTHFFKEISNAVRNFAIKIKPGGKRFARVTRTDRTTLINPKDVIARLGVDTLNSTAEAYFSRITDPIPQLGKPFTDLLEAPDILYKFGLLLSGLKLGKTMTVLDFGAGTCWLSRLLNQLQCVTISIDVSKTALDLGKRLFAEYPIVGSPIAEPKFLHFDGHNIDLPDDSVDRIVCFDALHHIPNQHQILKELGRILKLGGIAGFSEPGRQHSRSPQSQSEMRNYDVLENDIILEEIVNSAEKAGFSGFYCKLLCNRDFDLDFDTYQRIISSGNTPAPHVIKSLWPHIYHSMNDASVFFLKKGEFTPDSRSHMGLSHVLTPEKVVFATKAGDVLRIPVRVANTGRAKWLNSNIQDIGVVKLGVHLYDENNKLLNLDFARSLFDTEIHPGDTITTALDVQFDKPGTYNLALDLVAEQICWFENVGSQPVRVKVSVES
jgi:SAM-dependent methyltransferase